MDLAGENVKESVLASCYVVFPVEEGGGEFRYDNLGGGGGGSEATSMELVSEGQVVGLLLISQYMPAHRVVSPLPSLTSSFGTG